VNGYEDGLMTGMNGVSDRRVWIDCNQNCLFRWLVGWLGFLCLFFFLLLFFRFAQIYHIELLI